MTAPAGDPSSGSGKLSPIKPKNLSVELDADLLGSGNRIAKLDREYGIVPFPVEVNRAQAQFDLASHTPFLIKRTKKTKEPGPIWQRPPVGTDSMRKRRPSPTLKFSPAIPSSLFSATSFGLSSESRNSEANSLKQRLLKCNGKFTGYAEQEEESPSPSEGEASVGMKRSRETISDTEVQTRQLLTAWKRLRPGPSNSA